MFGILLIVSLLGLSYGNVFNFQNDMEYNFHIRYEAGSMGIKTIDFDADLRVQKDGKKFYCQFNNINIPESGKEELEKPFAVVMKGESASLQVPPTWGKHEILHAHGMLKAVLADRSNLTKFISGKATNIKQTVYMPLGFCEADITKTKDPLTIEAITTKAQCTFSDYEQALFGDFEVNDSSYTKVKILYENKNPIQVEVHLVLRLPKFGDLVEMTGDITIDLIDSKKLVTLSSDEILALHKGSQ